MVKIHGMRGGELPSGGVPILPPQLNPNVPAHIRARVMAERQQQPAQHYDAHGRPQRAYIQKNGFGEITNTVTLPRFEFLERGKAKEGAGL